MVSQPNFSKPEYTSKNIFAQAGYTGQCTWYANGRMQELGYSKAALDTMHGNACDWDNTAGNGCSVTSEPKVHSLANWEAGVGDASSSAGHVAVVEEINGNSILVSEANWANQYWHTRTINRNTSYWPSHFILVPGGPSGPGGPPTFQGKTAPAGVKIRREPSTHSDVIGTEPGNVVLTFEGWKHGEAVEDIWTHQMDDRWFKLQGRDGWIASAIIDGNPPDGMPPLS